MGLRWIYSRICWGLAFAGLLSATSALAKRGSEALYTEPFDLAAGGTCLTRASQEGILFGNPALLPLGGAWVRWFGLQMSTIADHESATASSSLQNLEREKLVDEVFSRSLHLGQTFTFSFMHKNIGISLFDRLELDVEGSRYEASGLPAIKLGLEAYAGGVLALAAQPLPWLSLGLSSKYIFIAEPVLDLPIADPQGLEATLGDQASLRDQLDYGVGAGADLGVLFFSQARHLDYSLALKVDDLGGTALKGVASAIPQSMHVGLGLAFHGKQEVLHLSLEHRDVLGAYDEEARFKKIYVGARLMLRKLVGLAAGYYQGIPSFGIRSDLWFWKVGMTYYGRELGDFPGDRQRNLIMVYTTIGF